jgi:hypothetical protein
MAYPHSLQRKSRRLVARAVKEAEAKRFEDEHALHVDGTAPNGADSEFLLQRCLESEIALITQQVMGTNDFSMSLEKYFNI